MNIKYWEDIKGKKHLISKMTTNYLRSCVHYSKGAELRIGRPWRGNHIKAIKSELEKRGVSIEGINFEF